MNSEVILDRFRRYMEGLGTVVGVLLAPPDPSNRNTAVGASLAVRGAVAAYRLTGDPAVVAVSALIGVAGAYYGAILDNENAQHQDSGIPRGS